MVANCRAGSGWASETLLRTMMRSKVSLAQPLPARQLATIEHIPGVAAITPFSFYGGLYKGDEKFTSFAQFAVDPIRATNLLADAKLLPEQMAAWLTDRTTCIVGKMTADRYGLKVGDRMQFTGQIYPCDLEFKIAGIYSGTADDRNLMFHHKYLDEAMGNPGTVGCWWGKASSVEEASAVTERINKAFLNTSAEVRAETERAFQLGFVSMWANIKTLRACLKKGGPGYQPVPLGNLPSGREGGLRCSTSACWPNCAPALPPGW